MDRLCDFVSNLHLNEKRNSIVSIIAGGLVRGGIIVLGSIKLDL